MSNRVEGGSRRLRGGKFPVGFSVERVTQGYQ